MPVLLFVIFALIGGTLHGEENDMECIAGRCGHEHAINPRTNNIPFSHVAGMSDEYLTGYVQSLVDMHYYEFQVRVLARHGAIFVFNLPNNCLISHSILCFIYDIPCVKCVHPIKACLSDFICSLQQSDPKTAEEILSSKAFQSMCKMPPPRCQIRGIWFPQNTLLFLPIIADPRQVMNAAALRFDDNVIGKHVGAVSFGDDFIFLRLKDVLWWHGDMDLGIEGGIFSVFDLDHAEACFVNSDFYVAALITYAFDSWSFRFRLWHLSSHLGDEFMLSNPDIDRKNLSDNGVDFFVSLQICRTVRLYAGIGDIFAHDDSFPEHPLYFGWGGEVRVFGDLDCFNRLHVQPFFATYFSTWERNSFFVDQNYDIGVEWSKIQGVGRKFRIWFEYHNGFSWEGQFLKERSDYYAIKMNYGF
ncbi:MAG: DUF1207 domain-containing protein [Chlamydiales bacterium]